MGQQEQGYAAPEATAIARRVINAAVIADLERAGWERARRECAEELRRYADAIGRSNIYDEAMLAQIEDALNRIAVSWSQER